MKLMKFIELEGRRGEYPARYTMLGSQDYSGVVVQYFGDTVWIEGNGEFRPVMPTYIGLVSIPPMISSLSHTAAGSLSLEWSSGLAPFQLLFRENLDESWSTIERGIVTRSITIPLDNTKSGFYGIRSTK
jgi:hypothetical protein